MKSTFDELKDLIDYIQSVYTEITDEWLRETPTKTNLKNALVADIDADGIIYKSIMEYVQLLNEKSADITLPLASVCSCKVTARVKAQNSIEFKIQNYKTERHEFGKIPINKCINDLFGIRIFLREPLTFDEVYSFIEDTYPNRYRCIDSSKFHWKNSFIMHMRITSVSILSGYLKITFMHSVMVLSLTVSMRLLSEVAPNM